MYIYYKYFIRTKMKENANKFAYMQKKLYLCRRNYINVSQNFE